MRHIFRAMARGGSINGATTLQRRGDSSGTGIISITKPRPGELVSSPPADSPRPSSWPYVLAPAGETEQLMDMYFSDAGLLYPYIHEATFRETYQQLKRHNFRGSVRRTWLGLLNMVLAMAVSPAGWTQSPTQDAVSSTSSETFYQRARELCKPQMLRGTTLEIGKSHPPSVWPVWAAACRVANTASSPISAPRYAVSPRGAELCPDVVDVWLGRQGCALYRSALQGHEQQVWSCGTGDEEEDVVWVCVNGPVSLCPLLTL
jgi:hypothetical protein